MRWETTAATSNVRSAYHQGIEAGLGVELLKSVFVKGKDGKPGDRLKLDQTYTLNDFHFENDPVYHDNRLGGIPIHLYEVELQYEMPCGFYAGPNVQCNLTPYPVDQQNTLNADSYALLGFKVGLQRAKGFSIFFQADNLTDKRYASSVDPIPNGSNRRTRRCFIPVTAVPFTGAFLMPGEGGQRRWRTSYRTP